MLKKYHQFSESQESINEAVTIFGGVNPKWGSFEHGPENHAKRPLGNWQSDNAWDIFAKAGTPVYSITSGKVEKVKDTGKKSGKVFGTHVTVNSSGRNPKVFYTHLKNVVVKPGDKIEAGDQIGEISEWGTSDSTHVHVGLSGNKHIKDLMSEEGSLILADPTKTPVKMARGEETDLDLKWDDKYEGKKGKTQRNVSDFLSFLRNKKNDMIQSAGGSVTYSEEDGKGGGLYSLLGIKRRNPQSSPVQNNQGNSPVSSNPIQQEISPVSGAIVPKGKATSQKDGVAIVIEALEKYGIVNPLTQKAILSVIGKESGFNPRDEDPYNNTSNERIRKIFGSRVSKYTDSELTALKKDVNAFWDVVYGGRYGNDSPGDGAKYIGRGYNGLTFKGNYEKYNDLLRKHGTNVDIVNNPTMVNDPKIAAEVCALYFLNGLSSKHSKKKYGNDDPNDFTDFDKALRAATNANAGWGKNIEGSRALKNATAYAANFDINDLSSTKLA